MTMVATAMTAAMILLQAVQPSATKAVARPSKNDGMEITCKREKVTGSLVAVRKVCQRKVDWDRDRLSGGSYQGGVCSDRSTCAGN